MDWVSIFQKHIDIRCKVASDALKVLSMDGLVLGAGFIEKKEDKVTFADFSSAEYVDEYASRDVYRIRSKQELLAEGELEKALKLLLGKK